MIPLGTPCNPLVRQGFFRFLTCASGGLTLKQDHLDRMGINPMVMIKRKTVAEIKKSQNNPGGPALRKMSKQHGPTHEKIVEENYRRRLSKWSTFTAQEAAEVYMDEVGGGNKQFAANLPEYIADCMGRFTGIEYGELKGLIESEYSHCYQDY